MSEQDASGTASGGVPLGPWDRTDDPTEPSPRRRWGRGRWAALVGGVVAATLVAGGVSYAVVTNRADYRLQQALEATADHPYSGARLSIETDQASLAALGAPAGEADQVAGLLDRSALRVASAGDDAGELTLEVDGASAVQVVASATSVGVVVDWRAAAPLPGSSELQRMLASAADQVPEPLASAVQALRDGRAVDVALPGDLSEFGIDGDVAQSRARAAAIGRAVGEAAHDHATVADGGSDEYGRRFDVTVPLAPLWDAARAETRQQYGSDAPAGLDEELPAELTDAAVTAHLWESDGVVSRISVDLGPLLARSQQQEHGGSSPDVHLTVVVVPDHEGVRPLPGSPVRVDLEDLTSLLFLSQLGA